MRDHSFSLVFRFTNKGISICPKTRPAFSAYKIYTYQAKHNGIAELSAMPIPRNLGIPSRVSIYGMFLLSKVLKGCNVILMWNFNELLGELVWKFTGPIIQLKYVFLITCLGNTNLFSHQDSADQLHRSHSIAMATESWEYHCGTMRVLWCYIRKLCCLQAHKHALACMNMCTNAHTPTHMKLMRKIGTSMSPFLSHFQS